MKLPALPGFGQSFKKVAWRVRSVNKKKVFAVLALLVLVASLPIGVYLLRRQQTLRSRADYSPRPYTIFSGEIYCQDSGKDKVPIPGAEIKIFRGGDYVTNDTAGTYYATSDGDGNWRYDNNYGCDSDGCRIGVKVRKSTSKDTGCCFEVSVASLPSEFSGVQGPQATSCSQSTMLTPGGSPGCTGGSCQSGGGSYGTCRVVNIAPGTQQDVPSEITGFDFVYTNCPTETTYCSGASCSAGSGTIECTDDSQCAHLECVSNSCTSVANTSADETDQCTDDSDCATTTYCSGASCSASSGTIECTDDSACYHLECQNKTCTQVANTSAGQPGDEDCADNQAGEACGDPECQSLTQVSATEFKCTGSDPDEAIVKVCFELKAFDGTALTSPNACTTDVIYEAGSYAAYFRLPNDLKEPYKGEYVSDNATFTARGPFTLRSQVCSTGGRCSNFEN